MTKQIVNLISSYVTKIWSISSIYLFIPFYIKFLGTESYGIISLYTLFIGVLSFADAGFSSAITREFATEGKETFYKMFLLIRLEKVFFFVCATIVCFIFFGAYFVVHRWLNTSTIDTRNLIEYIQLIAIAVGLQMMASIYGAGLMGLQKHYLNNCIQLSWSISKSVGVLIVLSNFRNSVYAFLIWQIICNCIYIFSLRLVLMRQFTSFVASANNSQFKITKEVWQYISAMLFIGIISSINIQADRIITSNLFTLTDFGYYNLASVVAQIPFLVATPIALVVFPLFTNIVTASDKEIDFKQTFQRYAFLVSILVIPITTFIFLFNYEIVSFWMRRLDVTAITKIALAAKYLSVGGCFLALQLIPYYAMLAKGKTKFTIIQSLIQLAVIVPLLFFCIKKYNFRGIGFPWLIVNSFSFFFLLILVKYVFFKKVSYLKLLASAFLLPFLGSLMFIFLFYFISLHLSYNGFVLIAMSIVYFMLVLTTSVFCYNLLNKNNTINLLYIIKK